MNKSIPFNKPFLTGNESNFIKRAHENAKLSGDGPFTERCSSWLKSRLEVFNALLTHSCTAALEMAALLAEIKPGDEVIMPSYTFVSTANAFVLRGAVPVFVDIRPDTLNIDETLIERAITSRTRAIVPVHYAGVACEMDKILEIALQHKLLVVEDAAQGIMAKYKNRALGTIGDFGCLSFHETKNIICGEGGALLIRDATFSERAEIIREKGTNRSKFFRGQTDKYTWCDIGSSYLPGELISAFLWAQMEQATRITEMRISIWNSYYANLFCFMNAERVRLPVIPPDCVHNGHMFYLIARSLEHRTKIIDCLQRAGVSAVFHYVPLHSSPAGRKFGRVSGMMTHTDSISNRLLRLPLWIGVDTEHVLNALEKAI